MRHILSILVFVPFCEAEVFIVPGDELGLTFLKEQGIGEENFTSRQHLLLRIFLGLRDQLMNEHVKGHVVSPLEIFFIILFLNFETLFLFDLRDAAFTATYVLFVLIPKTFDQFFRVFGCSVESRPIAATEGRFALDVTLQFFLLFCVLLASFATSPALSKGRTAGLKLMNLGSGVP